MVCLECIGLQGTEREITGRSGMCLPSIQARAHRLKKEKGSGDTCLKGVKGDRPNQDGHQPGEGREPLRRL